MARPKQEIQKKTVYTRIDASVFDHLEAAYAKYSERQPISKQNFYNACIEHGLPIVEAKIKNLPKLI